MPRKTCEWQPEKVKPSGNEMAKTHSKKHTRPPHAMERTTTIWQRANNSPAHRRCAPPGQGPPNGSLEARGPRSRFLNRRAARLRAIFSGGDGFPNSVSLAGSTHSTSRRCPMRTSGALGNAQLDWGCFSDRHEALRDSMNSRIPHIAQTIPLSPALRLSDTFLATTNTCAESYGFIDKLDGLHFHHRPFRHVAPFGQLFDSGLGSSESHPSLPHPIADTKPASKDTSSTPPL